MKINTSPVEVDGEVKSMSDDLFKEFEEDTSEITELICEMSKKYKVYMSIAGFPDGNGFNNHMSRWNDEEVVK